jgi:hypothetical protein
LAIEACEITQEEGAVDKNQGMIVCEIEDIALTLKERDEE